MGIANFVLGYFLSGSGAQNSKEIGKALMKKTEINRTYNILLNASKRYVTNNLSPRGFIGVFNLYSGKLSSMLATEIPKIIFKNTVKGLSEMTVSTILLSLLSSFEAHDD